MKKLVATLCIAGSAFALSACESTDTGYVDTAVPYTQERTAGYDDTPVAVEHTQPRAERTFRQMQSK